MGNLSINLGFAGDTQEQSFKYKDFRFGLEFDLTRRDFVVETDLQAIQNSIKNIFLWKKGERIIQPNFGSDVHKILFQPITNATAKNLAMEIRSSLETWEPRIKINEVGIVPVFTQSLSMLRLYCCRVLKIPPS